ncbi:hypothetical protein YC2023_032684 [Brassica napus]
MKMTAHLSAPDAWVDVVERFSNDNNKTLKSVSPSIVYINIIYMRTTKSTRCLNLGSYNYLGFGSYDEYCTPLRKCIKEQQSLWNNHFSADILLLHDSSSIKIVSYMSSCTIEEVASSCNAVRFLQIYVFKKHEIAQMVIRAEKAGFKAIVLTNALRIGTPLEAKPLDHSVHCLQSAIDAPVQLRTVLLGTIGCNLIALYLEHLHLHLFLLKHGIL